MKKLLWITIVFFTHLNAMKNGIFRVAAATKSNELYQRCGAETYSIHRLMRAHNLAEKHRKEWEVFAQETDRAQLHRDKEAFGPMHDGDYFAKLHLPLLLSAQTASTAIEGKQLIVTQCPHTAVDVFPFVEHEGEFKLIIIGKYIPRLGREKYATTGGITEYGETFEQTAVREAQEEAHLELDKDSLLLLGTRSSPDRDPRGRHIASIFYGCITDQLPQPSDEAQNVYLASKVGIESTAADDWCARDHREMALEAFARLPEIVKRSLEK